MRSTFGLRLREAITEAGFTQKDFARAVGSYPANMSQWVNGTISPTVANIRKILEMLPDTDARWLLTGESTPHRITEAGRAMLRDAQQSSPDRQQGE